MIQENPILPGIVPRLRLVFLIIILTYSLSVIIGAAQLRQLSYSVNNLTNSSVSIFVQAQETEQSLKDILLLVQRIDVVSNSSDLAQIGTQIEERLSMLDASLALPTAQVANAEDYSLSAALSVISDHARDLVAMRDRQLGHEDQLSLALTDLEANFLRARALLENMSYDSELFLPVVPSDLSAYDIDQLERFLQRYSQSVRVSSSITSILLELEALAEEIDGIENLQVTDEIGLVNASLRHRIRNIAVLIGQLPEGDHRVNLAKEISDIRSRIFGQDGVWLEYETLYGLSASLSTLRQQLGASFGNVSGVTDQQLVTARHNVEASRHSLAATVRRMAFITTGVSLVMLATIAVAMSVVVERQINRRMARLTTAVLTIAEGDTEFEVDVSGPDEIGKMAKSLEVFKLNASELRRSNEELEKFAYVAAHDLRSPLRAIQDLSQWTLEDEENVLTDESKEFMGLMTQRIGRLNLMLGDLLEYSRTGRETSNVATASMADLVENASEMLDPEMNFEINFVGPLTIVTTYVTPLRQILLNLINNAIKHHDRSEGNIKVGVRTEKGRLFISVTDDGPGIPPKFHDKIFGLFQTLLPRDEVEGSGLGLAIISKLVEHHGGKICVTSDPDIQRGTTFLFDLPEMSDTKLAPTGKIAA